MSTSGWRQGGRKRDSLGEENEADLTPGRFPEGLPTPLREPAAVGWKPGSRGTVTAQLSSERILSHSFCFPSRPCGDMSRSPAEVETSLPQQQQQQQHPRGLAPRSPLSWCCSPGSLGFPSESLLARRDAAARQEPSLAKGPWPCCGSGARRVFGAGGAFAACCAASAWTRALLSSGGRDTLSPGFCVWGVSRSVLPAVCSPLEVSCASSCRGAHPSQPPCPFSWFVF